MLHAFIDESGQRAHTPASSDCFLMSAVVIRDTNLSLVNTMLESLRNDLGRPSGGYLTWKNMRSHGERVHIAKTLGVSTWFRTVTVVACKRHLTPGAMTQDEMYLLQLRYLLERLSWLGRREREVVSYTLAHIRGFKIASLRAYEAALRGQSTQIDWKWLDPAGGQIDQPQRDERLQLADLVVSAIAPGFNPDKFGNLEDRYAREVEPTFYRHSPSAALTSYGLKMHPWNTSTKAAYPWVAAL